MKAFYSLSHPFDVEQLCLLGCFAIKMLSYRPKFVQQRSTRPRGYHWCVALLYLPILAYLQRKRLSSSISVFSKKGRKIPCYSSDIQQNPLRSIRWIFLQARRVML